MCLQVEDSMCVSGAVYTEMDFIYFFKSHIFENDIEKNKVCLHEAVF